MTGPMQRIQGFSKEWLPGARGMGIIFLGADAISRGWAYLPFTKGPKDLPYGLELLTQYIPLTYMGAAWLLVGLLCVVQGSMKARTWAGIAFYCALRVGWGAAYLIGYFYDPDRDWVSAAHYVWVAAAIACLAFLVPAVSKKTGGIE